VQIRRDTDVERSHRGQLYRSRIPSVKVDKVSVSFDPDPDPDLGDAVRAAPFPTGRSRAAGGSNYLVSISRGRRLTEGVGQVARRPAASIKTASGFTSRDPVRS